MAMGSPDALRVRMPRARRPRPAGALLLKVKECALGLNLITIYDVRPAPPPPNGPPLPWDGPQDFKNGMQ